MSRANRQRQPLGEVERAVGEHRVRLVVVEAAALDRAGRNRDVDQVVAGLVVVKQPEQGGRTAPVAFKLELQLLAKLFVIEVVARGKNVGGRVIAVP